MRFRKPIRLPAELYANGDQVFHCVLRTHPEVRTLAPALRQELWESVLEQRTEGRIELLVACLMPDHLHLLAAPSQLDLITFVRRWKSWTTRLAWKHGYRGAVWQPRFYDRGIREMEFETVANYIVRNPVDAGHVESEREWPHSWAFWWEDPT